MKKFFLALAAMALIAGGCLFAGQANAAKTYSGTAYIAGQGGHFAKVVFTVNPADTEHPITVKDLGRIVIGTWQDHSVHDPRIDTANRNIMMFSTYTLDPKGDFHTGKINLKTGKVIMDVAIKPDPRAKVTGAGYCASGQTKDYYIPVTMTDEGYIDIRSKKTWKLVHRVFPTSLGMKDHNYVFMHGTNTPDMKEFIVINNMGNPANRKPGDYSALNGDVTFNLVDMKSLLHGKLKVIAKTVLHGSPGDTITFRQSFTPDGKYLLQSGGDRMWVLDAKTLKLVDQQMMGASDDVPAAVYPPVIPSLANGQMHDAIATPDSKYALITVRVPLMKGNKPVTDGVMQLYDIQNHKMIGQPVSVCGACHYKYGENMEFSAALCGIDVNWKK
ncbi:MAG: hypothetical protein M0Z58_07155 [Nitrospiraceae bacterium]|nr:hypothetical protein [Nitrospiraceae bacterium]